MTGQLFVVTSGRSGSYLLYKLFSMYPQVQAHHEFACVNLQQLGVLNYLQLNTYMENSCHFELKRVFNDPLLYADNRLFIDSSNKTAWLIPLLNILFPNARFLWLVRDGRKVVSSYYNKLADECYRDEDVTRLYRWLDKNQPDNLYWFRELPSPVKANWWPVPRLGDPISDTFRYHYDRFQRICWHWQEVNKVIGQGLNSLPMTRWRVIRLEDLVCDRTTYERLMAWVGLEATGAGWQLVGRPTNVNTPINYPLTTIQNSQYWQICGEMHRQLGYTEAEAEDVRY